MKKRTKAGTSKAAAEARRAKFVEGMLINNGNQTKAAIYAGFSEKSAYARGSELVKDRKVSELLEARRAEQLAKSKLTSDEVLQSLARDVRFDPAKLYDKEGNLLPLDQIDEDTRVCIRGVEVFEEFEGRGKEKEFIGYTKKVKYPEKTAAREQAMKHFGLYESDNRQKPSLSVAIGVLTVKPDEGHFNKVWSRVLGR